ncbi:MAG: hypothetical protein JWR61_4013 [Ferruginibacter sp.]|nr:hypothetical protein [Ferruginibacter sp.]
MRNCILSFLLVILNESCTSITNKNEDPLKVAKFYCNCVNHQLAGAKDSSVNLNDCETLLIHQSRLLTIYTDFDNLNNYSYLTIDSARKFATQVFNIEDTLCYEKLDFRKVKKIPHIKM